MRIAGEGDILSFADADGMANDPAARLSLESSEIQKFVMELSGNLAGRVKIDRMVYLIGNSFLILSSCAYINNNTTYSNRITIGGLPNNLSRDNFVFF